MKTDTKRKVVRVYKDSGSWLKADKYLYWTYADKRTWQEWFKFMAESGVSLKVNHKSYTGATSFNHFMYAINHM